MKNNLIKVVKHVGKVYARGFVTMFTITNIVDVYKNGKKKIFDDVESKVVISAGWPVILPLMSVMGASDQPQALGVLMFWALLIILP
jgi:hypothetical protein